MRRFNLTTRFTTPLASSVITTLVSEPCSAHPGHGIGGGGWSLFHYLTEPEHVLPALGLALLVVSPLIWRRAARARQAGKSR